MSGWEIVLWYEWEPDGCGLQVIEFHLFIFPLSIFSFPVHVHCLRLSVLLVRHRFTQYIIHLYFKRLRKRGKSDCSHLGGGGNILNFAIALSNIDNVGLSDQSFLQDSIHGFPEASSKTRFREKIVSDYGLTPLKAFISVFSSCLMLSSDFNYSPSPHFPVL